MPTVLLLVVLPLRRCTLAHVLTLWFFSDSAVTALNEQWDAIQASRDQLREEFRKAKEELGKQKEELESEQKKLLSKLDRATKVRKVPPAIFPLPLWRLVYQEVGWAFQLCLRASPSPPALIASCSIILALLLFHFHPASLLPLFWLVLTVFLDQRRFGRNFKELF